MGCDGVFDVLSDSEVCAIVLDCLQAVGAWAWSNVESKGQEFAIKVIKYLKQTTEKWKKETNIGFTLYDTPSEKIGSKFAKIDKEKYGTIKDITDKGYYTDSYHINEKEKIDPLTRQKLESKFQKYYFEIQGGQDSFISELLSNFCI